MTAPTALRSLVAPCIAFAALFGGLAEEAAAGVVGSWSEALESNYRRGGFGSYIPHNTHQTWNTSYAPTCAGARRTAEYQVVNAPELNCPDFGHVQILDSQEVVDRVGGGCVVTVSARCFVRYSGSQLQPIGGGFGSGGFSSGPANHGVATDTVHGMGMAGNALSRGFGGCQATSIWYGLNDEVSPMVGAHEPGMSQPGTGLVNGLGALDRYFGYNGMLGQTLCD